MIIVVVLFPIPSISGSTVFANQSGQAQAKLNDSNSVVLEVTGEGIFPLYFRLYLSGRVEYQTYEWSKSEYKKELVTHEFKIDKQETDGIIALLQHPRFLSARAVYPRLVTYEDSNEKQTISYYGQGQKKQVLVENYYGSNKKDSAYYPEPITKLMSKISDLTDRDYRMRTQ
jgi:hypothetical protein